MAISARRYLAHLPDELEKKWEEYWEQATDKAKAWMTTTDAKAATLRATTKEKVLRPLASLPAKFLLLICPSLVIRATTHLEPSRTS
jgi:hypothetical protein